MNDAINSIPRDIFESEHNMFRDSVRKFLQAEAVPHHDAWEKQGQVDKSIWTKAGEQGFLAPSVPEAYGGLDLDFRFNAIVNEEVNRLCLSGLGWGLHSDIAVPYVVHYGREEQKQKYLPKTVTGETVMAIAMTEPGAGSDLQGIKTTAILDGDHYVVNGSKTFITNGQLSDLIIVVAKTDPGEGAKGISLFLVESDREGFARGKNLEKLGLKAQDTSELFFNDVRIPKENLLGEEGQGFTYLMNELPQERLSVSVGCLANAESILEQTVEYVKGRNAFGKPIAKLQNTQFKLAEINTQLTAARVFIDRCIELQLKGKLDVATAAKSKLLATEVQHLVLDECLQLHGGYGFMWEYPVARAYADARVKRIYAGSNEIMKLIISRAMLKD
ncbi:MAG: acyl-CoA dehydrogenase family protein [Gammaproteobacteria bacterium]|nr:acyl-CoA dehydrogenase family protein [Gammaproteobacteria bacterium]MDH5629225.1 acyl-CoA dehydrogenase family protein [Gammaproteobacteria bacterium]